MTTTDTRDTAATVAQAERLAAAGCEIVRVTAPRCKDAENLRAIRAELDRRGVRAPLVADIHFTPNAAMRRRARGEGPDQPRQLRRQEEVRGASTRRRVRGGGRARGASASARWCAAARSSAARCASAPTTARSRPRPEPLRRHAARHGGERARVPRRVRGRGLPRRRLQHEGEQPAGGHPGLPAARGAARRARAGRPGYPFHVGVTEAGDGEDGRIKSAIGIGALLEDGIGDTIRVSLTEDPVKEIPVARALAARYDARAGERRAVPADPGAPWVADPVRARAPRDDRSRRARGGANRCASRPGWGRCRWTRRTPRPRSSASWRASASWPARACSWTPRAPRRCRASRSSPRRSRSVASRRRSRCRRRSELAPALARSAARIVLPIEAKLAARAARVAGRRRVELPRARWSCSRTLERALAASQAAVRALGVGGCGAAHARGAPAGALPLRDRGVGRRRSRSCIAIAPGASEEPRCCARPSTSARPCATASATAIALPVRFGSRAGDALARLPHPPGRTPAHHLDRVHLLPLVRPHALRPRGDHRAHQGPHQHLKGVKIAIMGCIVNGPGEMADADFGY
jgi:4-hydroxy-3-methylbut-2-en-1-yl diphosphate synthase IspG/GcpE